MKLRLLASIMSLRAISQTLGNGLLDQVRSGLASAKADNEGTVEIAKNEVVKSTVNESNKQNRIGFFEQLLGSKTSTKEKPTAEAMTLRLADLKAKGNILRHHPLPNMVKSYVKDLKDFLGDLREHAYQAEHKDELFQRMKVVDENLDKLADKLLDEQKHELALVASLGELQGLLVDVFA